MNEKKNVKSALCEMVLPVISLSVSNADQEEDAESLSPERTVCGSACLFLSVYIASKVKLTPSRRFSVSTAQNNNQEMAHRRTSLPYNYKYSDNRNLSTKIKAATLPFVNIDFLQKIDEKGLPGTPANNLALYEEKLEEAV
eukprot:gene4313-20517_t